MVLSFSKTFVTFIHVLIFLLFLMAVTNQNKWELQKFQKFFNILQKMRFAVYSL